MVVGINVKFDINKQYKKPNLLLANPNKDEVAILNDNSISNMELSLRFNAISEFTFDVYNQYTDMITNKKKIYHILN